MRVTMRQSLLLLALLALAGPVPAASLFQAETLAEGTLYSDQVARKAGDLITIRIMENTTVSEETKTERSRESDVDVAVDLVPNSARIAATPGSSSVGTLPAVRFGSSKEYEGEGKIEATGRMTAVVTGRVLDVLDNGNLVVVARRSIQVKDDTKVILLSGICRTADISSGNEIRSEKLHNFQVAIQGEGPLTRTEQEGWLTRLLDILWPL